MRKLFFTTMLFFMGSHLAQASHLMGADMQYIYLGNSKYRITAKIYRDCRGIPFSNPSFVVTAGKNGNASCGVFNLSIKLRSIRDITPVCSSQSKPCSPQNTTIGQLGVEEHIYDTVVDFSVAPLSNFVGNTSCGEVSFLIGQCCRNSSITTGPANQDFWTSCTINLTNLYAVSPTATNNSPKYGNNPVIFTCCNRPYRYNQESIDSLEHDSVSYRLVPGLRENTGVPVLYLSPFSEKYPVSSFCIGGRIDCKPNPNANPPQGFFMDTSTGDLVFTPANCSEVAVLAIEVTEYRQTPIGSWVWIGKSRRDIEIAMRNDCVSNNPPEIIGQRKIYACPGDSICYSYSIKDSATAGRQLNPDTVSVKWNQSIPGATFKVKDPKPREKEAVFCWKIPKDIQGKSYSFTITAEDQDCPLKNITIAGVKVYLCDPMANVKNQRIQSLRIYPQPCTAGQPLRGLKQGASWEIYDLGGRKMYSGKEAEALFAPTRPGIYLLRSGQSATMIEVIP